jgi:cell division protease FtsH
VLTKIVRASLIVLVVLLAAALVVGRTGETPATETISYSELRNEISAGRITKATISPTRVDAERRYDPERWWQTRDVRAERVDDEGLVPALRAAGVEIQGTHPASGDGWGALLSSLIIPFAMIGLLLWMLRGVRGGPAAMQAGRTGARLYQETSSKVTFADVAGVDEAEQELGEVIEFLKEPEKFARLGGTLPKGILLVGPPGTGKTLLARAVAGEAGVPFFSVSGSEFVEMFVGVGAARVRDLFAQAKKRAPCIIFIDELDALGKARGAAITAHEEREQTLNQLLVELDGFDPREGVVLMAATNRPEILDPALLRPGRFDRHVLVDRPDKAGRRAILAVHAKKIALAPDADLDAIAGLTAGMVGADLANIINEAALLAVRRGKDAVGTAELQEAIERVIAGLEKRNRVLIPSEKERVAYHELGHALVALELPGQDEVRKISIVPRGIAALGYTLQLPTEDRFLMTRSELEDKLAVLLAGRAAEELIYGEVSTGAQDDLLKATNIARSMVRAYAMGEGLGPLSFERDRVPSLLEAPGPSRGDYGEDVARAIDAEMKRIVEAQYARARGLLAKRRPLLLRAAQELLAKETLTGDELRALRAEPRAA